MYKIFIVEDDASIFSSIKTYLEGFAMEVGGVQDFNQVLDEFRAFDPHLVVMDIGLPYKNGLYWTEKIRKISQVPLVFLSSMGEETDQVLAMNLGADDYMVKPISLALLLAKIKAQIRRTYEVQAKDSEVQDGDLSLNLDTMDLTYQGRKKKLTKNEFLILKACIQGRGKVISQEAL